jgi:ATP-dependent helicase HrpA
VQWITHISGQVFTVDQLNALVIPAHLNPYFRIENTQGKLLVHGRDLRVLTRKVQAEGALITSSMPIDSNSDQQYRSWTFGDLPEFTEVLRSGVRYKVYPALSDQLDHVKRMDFNHASQSQNALRQGVLRLLVLALPQQYKFARQQFSANRQLMLLGHGLSATLPLTDRLSERAFRDCFLPEDQLVPRSAEQFNQLIESRRADLNNSVKKVADTMVGLLSDVLAVNKSLARLNSPLFSAAKSDIEQQLSALLPKDFLQSANQPWFSYLPRYLKALVKRVEKISGGVERDTTLMRQVQPFVKDYQQLLSRKSLVQDELTKLKWMIEEFRVSLFAQELKTSMPVSAKRLTEQVEKARKEAG